MRFYCELEVEAENTRKQCPLKVTAYCPTHFRPGQPVALSGDSLPELQRVQNVCPPYIFASIFPQVRETTKVGQRETSEKREQV